MPWPMLKLRNKSLESLVFCLPTQSQRQAKARLVFTGSTYTEFCARSVLSLHASDPRARLVLSITSVQAACRSMAQNSEKPEQKMKYGHS